MYTFFKKWHFLRTKSVSEKNQSCDPWGESIVLVKFQMSFWLGRKGNFCIIRNCTVGGKTALWKERVLGVVFSNMYVFQPAKCWRPFEKIVLKTAGFLLGMFGFDISFWHGRCQKVNDTESGIHSTYTYIVNCKHTSKVRFSQGTIKF